MRRIILTLCIVFCWNAPTAADEGGGIYRGLPISGVEFEGLERRFENPIKKGLAVTGRRGFLGLGRIAYEPGMLSEDVERIRLFLAQRGYPYPQVDGDLEPDEKGEKVGVVFRVVPGPPVQVRSIEYVNLGEEPPLTEADRQRLGFAEGGVFTDSSAERARQVVLENLKQRGYAQARVELEVAVVDSVNVDLRFTGETGREWRFGEVRVSGVPEQFDGVVRRAANIPEGELYDPRTVRDATDDIRALRLFRKVDVSLVPADSAHLDYAVELSEREHRSIEFGVGYLTDDGPIVTAGWEHRNLFDGGRGFRIFGSASRFEQLIESSVTFPAMFHSPTTGIGSVAFERKVEPAYDSTDLRTSFLLNYRYNRRGQFTAGPQLQIIDVTEKEADPDVPEDISSADGPVTSLIVRWAYDNTNDPLFPSHGFRIDWDNQIAPRGFGSITKFYRTGARIAGYQRVRWDNVLAARVAAGIGWPLWGSEDLIINYRYFAGGSNSHRGYHREQLGPLDTEGNPRGGELVLLGGLEWRFPVWKALEGVLFLDSGQVWTHYEDMNLSQLSYAWGPGLAIKSPVGPIRFDYGIRIDPPDDGRAGKVFHFAVGYAF